jgi:glyoxylase-like metal-dependent hydrolase (beta-lactamase superfamily II)
MKHISRIFLTVAMLINASSAFSQGKEDIKVVQLNNHLYKLTADRGRYIVNMVASVGNDGLLLVDAGEQETAEALKIAIDTMGYGNPKIIINTHAHVDHTGGNAVFGKDPVIIAHDILRTRLRSGSYLFDEFPNEALPKITFTDSMTLYFNGEEIRLIAFPGCHDDNDILVWFVESKIVCVGDLANGQHYPSVEEVTGNILRYRDVVPKIIDALPEDVTIVSGHADDCRWGDLKTFHEGIVKTSDIIRTELDKGKDRASMIEENVLAEWESFAEGYVSTEEWIEQVILAYKDTIQKKTVYEPIYFTLKEKGADAAVEHLYELKDYHSDEYRFNENDIVFMALKLYKNGKYPEAIKFFEFCIKEFPDGMYAYYYYFTLGNIYIELGDEDLALENYKKSYELKQTETVAGLLEKYQKN